MCISKQLPTVRELINAESSTAMVGCVGQWTSVTGVDVLRIAYSVRGLTGGISVVPVIQFADVRTDRPGDWTTIGANARTSNGDSFVEKELVTGSETADHFYFRIGLQYTNDTSDGHADCRVMSSYKCFGEVVATTTLELQATTVTTQYKPITGVLPAVGVTDAKAAFLLTGGANIEYSLAYRTFTADDEEGSGRTTLGSMHTPASDDYDEYILVDTSIAAALSGKMFYQLGVAYDSGGAASTAYGTLSVMAAVRGS